MAVANFHYITRMSSGFKVYILEGMSLYVSAFSARDIEGGADLLRSLDILCQDFIQQ